MILQETPASGSGQKYPSVIVRGLKLHLILYPVCCILFARPCACLALMYHTLRCSDPLTAVAVTVYFYHTTSVCCSQQVALLHIVLWGECMVKLHSGCCLGLLCRLKPPKHVEAQHNIYAELEGSHSMEGNAKRLGNLCFWQRIWHQDRCRYIHRAQKKLLYPSATLYSTSTDVHRYPRIPGQCGVSGFGGHLHSPASDAVSWNRRNDVTFSQKLLHSCPVISHFLAIWAEPLLFTLSCFCLVLGARPCGMDADSPMMLTHPWPWQA